MRRIHKLLTMMSGGGAATPWYLQGGIAEVNGIIAWQWKAAADKATAYTNLANPGTYDLTEPAKKPTWTTEAGLTWTATDQYLSIGAGTGPNLKPVTIIGGIVRSATGVARTILGGTDVNGIQIRLDTDHKLSILKAGVIAIGTSGAAVPATHTVFVITYSAAGVYEINLNGARSAGGTNDQALTADMDQLGIVLTTAQGFDGVQTAMALYDTVLTRPQWQKVSNSIHYIGTGAYADMVVFDGNSMMDAATSPLAATTLGLLTGTWYGSNYGVSGQSTIDMLADVATQVYPHLDSRSAKNVAVVWEGTNDLKLGATRADAQARLRQLGTGLMAAGFIVVMLNIIKRTQVGLPETFDDDRLAINADMAANTSLYADVIVDIAALEDTLTMPDGVHPDTDSYNNIIAPAVAAAINAL